MSLIADALSAHRRMLDGLTALTPEIGQLAASCTACLDAGGRILWAGNGGSAADCQHLACELVGRFQATRRALASIALTTDTSILTAVGNDLGFEQVFARQVEALARPGDLLMALSTSGNSPNVLAAAETARRLGATVIGWTGADGGALAARVDRVLRVPSRNTARIQEGHILIGHILCDLIEQAALGQEGR